MIVYVSIGNSDDKLTQYQWSQYCQEIKTCVVELGYCHGEWFSPTNSQFQNACWCIEYTTYSSAKEAEMLASDIRKKYNQNSIAWSPAETRFI